jgi:hypothetical protein
VTWIAGHEEPEWGLVGRQGVAIDGVGEEHSAIGETRIALSKAQDDPIPVRGLDDDATLQRGTAERVRADPDAREQDRQGNRAVELRRLLVELGAHRVVGKLGEIACGQSDPSARPFDGEDRLGPAGGRG